MQRIALDQSVFKLSPWNDPVAQASPGDTICFETYDCYSNQITQENQVLPFSGWDRVNPATGPLYVQGARPVIFYASRSWTSSWTAKASCALDPEAVH